MAKKKSYESKKITTLTGMEERLQAQKRELDMRIEGLQKTILHMDTGNAGSYDKRVQVRRYKDRLAEYQIKADNLQIELNGVKISLEHVRGKELKTAEIGQVVDVPEVKPAPKPKPKRKAKKKEVQNEEGLQELRCEICQGSTFDATQIGVSAH